MLKFIRSNCVCRYHPEGINSTEILCRWNQVAYAKERSAAESQSSKAPVNNQLNTGPAHQAHVPLPPQPHQAASRQAQYLPLPPPLAAAPAPAAVGTGSMGGHNQRHINQGQLGNNPSNTSPLPPPGYFDGNAVGNASYRGFPFVPGSLAPLPPHQSHAFGLHYQQDHSRESNAYGANLPPRYFPNQAQPLQPPSQGRNNNFPRGFSREQAYLDPSSGSFPSGLGEPLGGNYSLGAYSGLPSYGNTIEPPSMPHRFSGQPQVVGEQQDQHQWHQEEVGDLVGGYSAMPLYPFGHHGYESGISISNSALYENATINGSAKNGGEANMGISGLYGDHNRSHNFANDDVGSAMGLEESAFTDDGNGDASLTGGSFDRVFSGFGVGSSSFGAYDRGRGL